MGSLIARQEPAPPQASQASRLSGPSPRRHAPGFVHPDARRGRGVIGNAAGRFEPTTTQATDDGWGSLETEVTALRTETIVDATRSIITRNTSPDVPFDRSINPYRGCEHGCSYCFARPTHAFLGMSPGLDFETRILIKPNAAELLDAELRKRGYRARTIAMGTNTDPYQPLEREHRITRSVLEVLARYKHPVSILTKSALVTRDIDILGPMAKEGLAKVCLSVTTLDRRLSRSMEPRASAPEKRLEALRHLSDAGIPTGVVFAPVIPGLNDHEMESVLEAGAAAGASEGGFVVLRLPLEVRDLFVAWVKDTYPDKAAKILRLIRDMRGGKDYDPAWHKRQAGHGPFATMIARRFTIAAKKLGLNSRSYSLNWDLFRPPPSETRQMSLF